MSALGIIDEATPYVRGEAARQTVLCGSYDEALEQLARQGIVIGQKRLVKWAMSVGKAMLRERDRELDSARA